MPSQVPESGSQPAAGIVRAVGRVPSVERVEANRVRSGRAERTVKAEGCSCTVATKHQRARSGDVGGAVAVAACRRSRHPTVYVSAETLHIRHMRRSLTCRPAREPRRRLACGCGSQLRRTRLLTPRGRQRRARQRCTLCGETNPPDGGVHQLLARFIPVAVQARSLGRLKVQRLAPPRRKATSRARSSPSDSRPLVTSGIRARYGHVPRRPSRRVRTRQGGRPFPPPNVPRGRSKLRPPPRFHRR